MKVVYEQLSTVINIVIATAVGFYMSPFIKKAETEAIKAENKEKLSIELGDVCQVTKEKIEKLVKTKQNYPDFYCGEIDKISALSHIRSTFIDRMYTEYFSQLTYEQRKLVKASLSIIKFINDLLSELEIQVKDKNVSVFVINNAIYHLGLLYWLTNEWEQQKSHSDFNFNNRTDDERVIDALSALKIKTTLAPKLENFNK